MPGYIYLIHVLISFFNCTLKVSTKNLEFVDQLQEKSKTGCEDRPVERTDTNKISQAAKVIQKQITCFCFFLLL